MAADSQGRWGQLPPGGSKGMHYPPFPGSPHFSIMQAMNILPGGIQPVSYVELFAFKFESYTFLSNNAYVESKTYSKLISKFGIKIIVVIVKFRALTC